MKISEVLVEEPNIVAKCIVHPFVENCQKFNIETLLIFSTYKCMYCKDNYYLENNNCILRTREIENCEILD